MVGIYLAIKSRLVIQSCLQKNSRLFSKIDIIAHHF